MVLDAIEIVYEQNMLDESVAEDNYTNAPFLYRKDNGYSWWMLILDIMFIGTRSTITGVSIAFYCPDYFENFLQPLDETVGTYNATYRLVRDLVDLACQYSMILLLMTQCSLSWFTLNPIAVGIHAGELLGEMVFASSRTIHIFLESY